MIKQDIYLYNWDWKVRVYYAIDNYDINTILKDLDDIGCSTRDMQETQQLLLYGGDNVGITYTSNVDRRTITVIGITSSADEFQNTFDHEKGHIAMHIARALNIDPFSEQYQYLAGDIGIKLFAVAKHFLCDKCRKRIKYLS